MEYINNDKNMRPLKIINIIENQIEKLYQNRTTHTGTDFFVQQ